MNKELKVKIEEVIDELFTGKRKIFYCSMAEISQKHYFAGTHFIDGYNLVIDQNYEEGLNEIFNGFSMIKGYSSTEALLYLARGLFVVEEFSLAGLIIELCNRYFSKGDYSDVPTLDKPYIKPAEDIAKNRYKRLILAFNYALYDDDFYSLEEFIKDQACKNYSFTKSKEFMKEEIQKFYDKIDEYNKQSKKIETTKQELSIKKGSTVKFGHYYQNNFSEKTNIEWIVLENQEDDVLLLSKKILDVLPYNERLENVTWANCSLRTWLNEDFYNSAFSEKEKSFINITTVKTRNNQYPLRIDSPLFSQFSPHKDIVDGGENVSDKVYLLSYEEIRKYFSPDEDQEEKLMSFQASFSRYKPQPIEELVFISKKIKASATQYAKNKNLYCSPDPTDTWWWLRSPGNTSQMAASIMNGVTVYRPGTEVNDDTLGVRPVIKVKMSYFDQVEDENVNCNNDSLSINEEENAVKKEAIVDRRTENESYEYNKALIKETIKTNDEYLEEVKPKVVSNTYGNNTNQQIQMGTITKLSLISYVFLALMIIVPMLQNWKFNDTFLNICDLLCACSMIGLVVLTFLEYNGRFISTTLKTIPFIIYAVFMISYSIALMVLVEQFLFNSFLYDLFYISIAWITTYTLKNYIKKQKNNIFKLSLYIYALLALMIIVPMLQNWQFNNTFLNICDLLCACALIGCITLTILKHNGHFISSALNTIFFAVYAGFIVLSLIVLMALTNKFLFTDILYSVFCVCIFWVATYELQKWIKS